MRNAQPDNPPARDGVASRVQRRIANEANRAFTAVEMLIVIGVIGILAASIAALSVPKVMRDARVRSAMIAARNAETAVTDMVKDLNMIPITEGAAGVATTGGGLGGSTAPALANAARLDDVLLGLEIIKESVVEKASFGNAATIPAGDAIKLTWNRAAKAFQRNPDAVTTCDWTNCRRLEARTSAGPAVDPSTATGGNFRLDGVTGLGTLAGDRVIAYMVFPNVPAKDAYELALKVDGDSLTAAAGSAQTAGRVVFAAPVAGVTTLYYYVFDM